MKNENFYKRPPGEWENFEHYENTKDLLNLNKELRNAGINLQITPDSNILDIGSGCGDFSEQAIEAGFKKTVSLDINPRSGNKSLNEVKGEIEELPFADETFDLVHSQMCFDDRVYNQDQKQMVREISRVLKKGGIYFSFEMYLDKQIITDCGLKQVDGSRLYLKS